jgi:hypothetical protein
MQGRVPEIIRFLSEIIEVTGYFNNIVETNYSIHLLIDLLSIQSFSLPTSH